MRPTFILIGLSLLFVALLILTAKPLTHVSLDVPLVPASHNTLYVLYLRMAQALFGTGMGVLMAANGALMLGVCWAVFRAGWGLADAPYRLLGATAAMVLFELNPMVIILPLTLGFLGGVLWVPLFLLVFITAMRVVENWSTFMRAITLALAWSLFLWVHVPSALVVLLGMIPWVCCRRRPMSSVGVFLTIFLLGTAVFSTLWAAFCALTQRWSLVQGPLGTLRELGAHLHQGLTTGWGGGWPAMSERIVHAAGWLSPFFLMYGVWVSGESVIRMLRERRASTADLAALLSLMILGIVLFTPGKSTLPGAWYLLGVLALWSPLIAQRLAVKENFYSRGFRLTFLAGFVVCVGTLWILHQGGLNGALLPGAETLAKLVAAVLVAGGVSHRVLIKHPLTLENRMQALLIGSALAYFLVMDFQLMR